MTTSPVVSGALLRRYVWTVALAFAVFFLLTRSGILIGDAMHRIHTGGSVGALFR